MWPFRRSQESQEDTPVTLENTIGPGTTVRGDLKSPGGVRVEGTVDGAVDAEGPVVISEGGSIHGTVRGRDVTVLGTVRGDVEATGHLEIGPAGTVEGDVSVSSFRMHTGGVFRGTSHMPGATKELGGERSARALPAPAESSVRATQDFGERQADGTLEVVAEDAVRINTLAPPADGGVPPPPRMRDLPPLTPRAPSLPLKSQERLVSAEPESVKEPSADAVKTANG